MLLAIPADIHANRQAFGACLDAARIAGAERIVLLGDIVRYGGDPEWAADTTMEPVEQGLVAVRGNHDHAIGFVADTATPKPRRPSHGPAAGWAQSHDAIR